MIVVMGATGHIGCKLVSHLLKHEKQVRCVARSFPQKSLFAGAEFALGDALNTEFLTESFSGCEAAFVMIPPNLQASELRVYQNEMGASIAQAIRDSGIKKVVNLSSVGADLESGTGAILGLHDQEERLSELRDVDLYHLRPGYFMENMLDGMPSILSMHRYFCTLDADLPLPLVSTDDVAARAAALLLKPDFVSHNMEHLLGPRDVTMLEAIRILGDAIHKPDCHYVQVRPQEMLPFLRGTGMSHNCAENILETAEAFNNESLQATYARGVENSTLTTIEEFAKHTFAEKVKRILTRPKEVNTDSSRSLLL